MQNPVICLKHTWHNSHACSQFLCCVSAALHGCHAGMTLHSWRYRELATAWRSTFAICSLHSTATQLWERLEAVRASA